MNETQNSPMCKCGHSIDLHCGSLQITDERYTGCTYQVSEGLVCACVYKPSEIAMAHEGLQVIALKAMLKYIEFDAASKCCPVCGGHEYHDSACLLAAFLYPEKAESYEYNTHSNHIHDMLFDVENDKRFESLRLELYQVPFYVEAGTFDNPEHPDNHGYPSVADHINKLERNHD